MTEAHDALTAQPHTPRTKLPVFEIVRSAYLAVGQNLQQIVSATGWWAAIAIVAAVLLGAVPETQQDAVSEPQTALTRLALLLVAVLMLFISWTGAAVTWHRFLLLGEQPTGSPLAHWQATLKYAFLAGALFCAAFAVVAIGLATAQSVAQDLHTFSVVAPTVALLAVAVALVVYRFSLVFPAVATGDTRMTFAASWKFTSGNTLRLILGVLLVVLPIELAGGLLTHVLSRIVLDKQVYAFSSDAIVGVDVIANAAMVSSFFSLCYRHLVGRGVDYPADYFT